MGLGCLAETNCKLNFCCGAILFACRGAEDCCVAFGDRVTRGGMIIVDFSSVRLQKCLYLARLHLITSHSSTHVCVRLVVGNIGHDLITHFFYIFTCYACQMRGPFAAAGRRHRRRTNDRAGWRARVIVACH